MSPREKENLISLISSAVVTLPYILYALGKATEVTPDTIEELRFWSAALLILIPVRIVVQIIVSIVVAVAMGVANPKSVEEKDMSDERDALIELRSDRFANNTIMFGLIVAFGAVAFGGSIRLMFIILLLGGFIGELIMSFVKIYYYRKGL